MRCTLCCVLLYGIGMISVLLILNARDRNNWSYSSNLEGISNLTFTKLSERVHVLYAVLDERNGNMGYLYVRVLLAARLRTKVVCKFPSGKEVKCTMYAMAENHKQPYGAYYANCRVPENEEPFNYIQVREKQSEEWRVVDIKYKLEDEKIQFNYEKNYGICVPTLFGEKYSARNIVEFMELNRLLGVDEVTLYVDIRSINDDLRRTLSYYYDQGFVNLVAFEIPSKLDRLWYHGQLITIADCLNRNTGRTKYLAFHDLDEYLLPTDTSSLSAVFESLFSQKVASLRINSQSMSLSDSVPPITLKNTIKSEDLDDWLTKCVVRPEMIFEQGIHHTSRVIQDEYLVESADPNNLVLLHYQFWTEGVTDTRMVDVYGTRLQQQYERAISLIGLSQSTRAN